MEGILKNLSDFMNSARFHAFCRTMMRYVCLAPEPYIDPRALRQLSYNESFNAMLRDEFLNVELFSSKIEASC
jgi:hypothetical protein